MGNIITLRDPLTFGKHKGLTGQNLMKSKEGTEYLIWAYSKTDIRIEDCIVNELIGHGLVKAKRPQAEDTYKHASAPFVQSVGRGNLGVAGKSVKPGPHGFGVCIVCGQTYPKKNPNQKYCSNKGNNNCKDKAEMLRAQGIMGMHGYLDDGAYNLKSTDDDIEDIFQCLIRNDLDALNKLIDLD